MSSSSLTLNLLLLVPCALAALLLLRSKRLKGDLWRATLTPLSSIIGSNKGVEAGDTADEEYFGHYFFSVRDPDGNVITVYTSHEIKYWGGFGASA